MMKLFENLIYATFLKRINRFVIECKIEDKITKAYLPNPGRLLELLLPDSRLILTPSKSTNSKLPFITLAVFKNKQPVLLHTHKTNDIAKFLFENNLLSMFSNYNQLIQEVKYKNSRFDFMLIKDKTKFLIEIKSCTLFSSKLAMFPDAPTKRGSKHILDLLDFSNKNEKGVIIFIVQNYDVKYFLPEFHTDFTFAMNLYKARDKLSILPIAVKLNNDLSIENSIKLLNIPWEIYEYNAKDSGVYLLLIFNDSDKKINVGKLGQIEFQKGFYVYVGSAKKNLQKRINRHRRKSKNKFWHIDYLLDKTKLLKIFPIRIALPVECSLANSIKKIADWYIPKFGSSDCGCPSHLFAFQHNPLNLKIFVDILIYNRMEKIFETKT